MREPAPEAGASTGATATAEVPVGPTVSGKVTVQPPPDGGSRRSMPPAGLGRGFWALCAAMFVANLGSGITAVAFPWLMTDLTDDPLLLSGVTMAAELPWLLLSLPAGVLVDRYDHRRLISSTHLGRALIVGLLAVAVFTGVTAIWMVYLVAFTIGALTVLNENAMQTILPRVVRPAQLNRANGNLMLADTTGGVFLGPALGGALLLVSASLPFIFDAGLYVVAAGLMLLVTVTARRPAGGPLAVPGIGSEPEPVPAARPSIRVEMAAGMRFFWQHRVLRQLGLFLGLLNLASAIIVGTQVLFAQEILGLNEVQYGLFFSVGAIGAAAGAGLAPMLETRLGPRRVLLLTLVGNSVISLVIGFTSNAFVVAGVLSVAAGLAVVWNVVTISYRQRIVPEHMLGRVNSIYRLLAWGPLAVGSLIGGVVVKIGIPVVGRETALRGPLFLSAAITAVLVCYALTRLRDGIWSADRSAVYGPDDDSEFQEDGMADGQLVGDRDAAATAKTGGDADPTSTTDGTAVTDPAFGGSGGASRPVLKALIAVNVLVAVIGLVLIGLKDGLSAPAAMYDGVSSLHLIGEMNGPAVDRGEVWRLISSMFVHYGLVHLAANMVMLGLAGWRLEPILGSRRFLSLYLLSGLGAGVATYLFDHGSLTAGASGANFGVFSALFLVCLRLRRRSVLAIVLLVLGVVSTFAVPGMAIAAHAAGLLVGAVVALGFALPGGARRDRLQLAVPVVTGVVLLILAVVGLLG